jgi:hypothetical protein
MNRLSLKTGLGIGAALLLHPLAGHAFNSGSNGADGALNPQANIELQLPPGGVFNFTSVIIPSGVTVTFQRNATNTPVVFLAQGDIVVAGTIDVSGKPSAPTNASDDGNPDDDGLPGQGGPGGFDGGRGGSNAANATHGGNGLGPGGGRGGDGAHGFGGNGSYGTAGLQNTYAYPYQASAGGTYGNELLRPLIGGSGGGGASSLGSGGGGGGGAILLAASGEIRVDGAIKAQGGSSGLDSGRQYSFCGGGGSGGAIRLVASQVSGRGVLNASAGFLCNSNQSGGGSGRIRVEADLLTGSLSGNPSFPYGPPTDLFVSGLPGLAITSIAGVPVPANPVGRGDVTLLAATPNPAEIVLHTNGVPPGTVIKVTMTPEFGASTTVDSPPTVGSLNDATTSVNLDVPDGRSVIMATTTFTVMAALGERLAPYAQGEPVERVRLTAAPGQPTKMVLLTASGREVEVPAAALAAGW